ncbi:hypothetical protein BDW59DRAFT_66755 [Aspergillus cavernicola]|uniref:Mediator complex subunit 15 KIX domain-containing protein n=1 Tax=Aspergillus cavernicola TaxID=176166 RepID=A0ABR4IEA8_9EURO
MNHANFSNVSAVMNTGAKPPGQMQGHKNDSIQYILSNVAQALQAQGPFNGWRAEVGVRDRTFKVHQMITSLRLIQPQVELRSAAQAAMNFEQKAFKEAATKADYDREFADKLVHIRDTRARQAAAMQGGMMQQGPATGMPGVGQSPFPQQMNRPMQASPMPNQQQMQMGMNDPNQQATMQQRQQQQQQQPQAMIQQQRAQQRPGGAAALNDDLNTLSPQEHENVCRVANQILQKTSPDDMNKIKVNLQNMSPEQKVYLSKKGMDPITYFFRCQALNQLRRYKRSRMEMARNSQSNGVDPANAMIGDPMMNPQQRQMFQNMVNMQQQRNSPFPIGNQQTIDPSAFIGNVENIQGQQADGLRSQEAGQLVVPASSSQMNQQPFTASQNMFQQVGQGNQVNMNNAISPQFLTQQHLPNAQAGPQDRTQQAAQFQPQSQTQTQAQRVQAAQKAQMAMSQAGQGNSHMQQPISQSPAMPMLNRPMAAPGQMSPSQAAAQVQPPSRQPGMGQHPPNAQQQGIQNRPHIPSTLPPHVQEQLAQMSTEQLTAFFMNQRRIATNPALARANAAQQAMAMQQSLSQANQSQQMVNGQMGNSQNMRASLGVQQQLAAMAGAQQPNQMMPGQQMSTQQRQQQHQQQQLYRLQLLRQHGGPGMEMTPEQSREMDRVPFPLAIFNNNPNAAPLPKNIKTWGQLKHLAATNIQLLGGMDIQKLMTLQKYHLAQLLKETSNRNLEQNGQPSWMSANFQGQPQPLTNPQQFQPGQQQPQFPMPQIRQITPQELQVARQRLGAQVENFTDEQLRDILRQRQMHAAQTRAAQALANQQNQQSQAQPPPPISVPPAATHVKLEPQAQQPVPQPTAQAQPAKPQAATSARTTKGPAPKQTPSVSKRKVQNEEPAVPQTSPIQASTQHVTSQGLPTTAPSRPTLPFTREQLSAMTRPQRAQLDAIIRRQQGQTRGTIQRAAAEDAWNHLPEKLSQLYNELAKNAPPEQPIAVTPEQRATMNQQLRDCTDYLGRLDALVQFISKIPNHEKNVRSILGMRIQLMRQFKPGPDWALNEQVTITPEYLTGTTNYIKKLFHHMIAKVNQQNQQQNQAPGQRSAASQGGPNMQQANQNMTPLNASNLQQLQQQEEALQRARRASSQTAASGASVIPPAPFGAPSPQGVPHAYGPGGIPPQELKLPPPKKRKQSHPSTTPVSGPSGPKAPAIKQATAEAKPVIGTFKCSVPECQYHYQGFTTQNDLDKHIEDNHKVEEPIDNALEFALESFSTLVKEEKADAQGSTKGLGFTIDMPFLASNKAGSLTKHEETTPMGRVSSQLAAKPTSPASSQQLTPFPSSNKAPSSSSLKPALTRDSKKEPRKPAEQGLPAMAMTKDPWADSAISIEAIRDTFMDLGDDGGLGFGPMDEFLNAEMFTSTQDTPDSVETGIVTQTPKDSDMPKNEDVGGKNTNPTEDSWIPMDWYRLPGHFEDGLLTNETCENIDWEMVDFKDGSMGIDDSGIAICAM